MDTETPTRGWQLGVDRGGTFTDVVARAPDGALQVRKLLTRSPAWANATVAALEEHARAGHPLDEFDELRLGTTVATNALLERAGARVLLLTTRGFADLLTIGHQDRPDLFALSIEPRTRLHAEVREIDERLFADGRVELAPEREQIAAALEGFEHVAVLFLHATVNPVHELLVEEVARAAGVKHVTLSHRVSPEPGAVARGDSTVADAYLTPLLRRHLAEVAAAAGSARVRFMQSSGGLVAADRAAGKDSLLSGPAGGAVAVAAIAKLLGLRAAIGLDMGGTSTDVCRCVDGEVGRVFSTRLEGLDLRAPAVDIVTVAAGGGSRLIFRDGRYAVGPESAGADPGPACYGRGGPATLTDANLLLGRLAPEHFPHLRLDASAARAALAAIAPDRDPLEAAAGFVAIANENMAAAIRTVSVARGHDVRDHALIAFGGAAGQHACALARRLGMRQVVVHPLAGVLSAWGLLLADVRHHEVAAVRDPATRVPDFPEDAARAALAVQGHADAVLVRSVDVRYAGADHALNLPWSEHWERDFVQRHRALYGFEQRGVRVELVAARVDAIATAPKRLEAPQTELAHVPTPLPRADRDARVAREADGAHGADAADHALPATTTRADDPAPWPVHRRAELLPGARIAGPAVIVEDLSTTIIDPGWLCRVDGHGHLLLSDEAAADAGRGAGLTHPSLATPDAADPVGLEVMGNRFMAIATQMGEHLRRVAHSTNIKERLDFSCAVFDRDGGLVANAPHIPVHLGAMGETVRALLADRAMIDGEVWLTNDPYRGGSHLPDLTVITPVFRDGALAFLVANRGHHADVGGPTPGSMPSDSRRIEDEGVLLSNVLLARGGELCSDDLVARFAAAGVRGTEDRLADLRAQVASNAAGARALGDLCDELGTAVVHAWMDHVRANAAAVMRDVLSGLLAGRAERVFRFADGLDDGSPVAVTITVRAHGRQQSGVLTDPPGARTVGADEGRTGRPHAVIDFTGTASRHAGNRNAPRAVAVAAVLYVFRTLAARPIPLNAGCLVPLTIVTPTGSLLDPRYPDAVAGGNVETSQRLVDVLFGALGVLAASQGTMNNLTFGDGTFGYYETICGGAGAGRGFHGASAVHTHMTNTRITDPEVLERRFPVQLREFSIRRGSGGAGTWRGGDGVVREFRFLRPLRVSVLAERRLTAPFGLNAGSGARGEQQITPTSVRILTPGGGGYGPPGDATAR